MKGKWTSIYIDFDGKQDIAHPSWPGSVDIDRASGLSVRWKNILNLPDLVAVEWGGDPKWATYRYVIHVRHWT